MTNFLLGMMFVFLGFFFALKGLSILLKLQAITHWNVVPIKITDARIESELEVIKYGRFHYYFPVLHYSYQVNDNNYRNERVSLDKKGIWEESKQAAELLLEEIKNKSLAYYDPSKPNEAIILPYLSSRRISHYRALVASGLILLFLGGLIIVFLM